MTDAVVLSQTATYTVTPGKPVTLSVTIGDGQVGGTSVSLSGVLVESGGEIRNLRIGAEGQDLRNASIECTTTVKDVNPATNHTTVTYAISGGTEDREFTYDVTVSQAGGRAVYLVIFLLS
jgi:hypothetical protein